ncbi:MAG: preprotein translocase subunit SecG [Planctomycetota bacterium]|jgi:preprotein translocase subunit SecG
MISLPLLKISFFMSLVAVLFVLCCIVLILIILVQKGRGGGLSGAFGGGMASGILGSKTGDFLTWVTIVLAGVFLTLAIFMARFYKPMAPTGDYDVSASAQQEPPADQEQPLPAEDLGQTAGDANTSADTNLPGS